MRDAAVLMLLVITAGVLLWLFSYIGVRLAADVFKFDYTIEQVWLVMWVLTAAKITNAEVNKDDKD